VANNFVAKDGNGNAVTFQSTDVGGGTQLQNVKQNDGTNDIKSASAANLAAQTGINAQMSTPPGNWAVNHTPAINTQATISKAAGAAGVRHVCTSITATLGQSGAGTAQGVIQVNLRDGATGAGTILWSASLSSPTTTSPVAVINLSGLNIVGSAATAMTLEFSAAGGANVFESVAMTGYDVS
jgi:hypothetical protein